MAGYVPGLLPANRSQEKEFVQAYEDVLERYKGSAGGGAPGPESRGWGIQRASGLSPEPGAGPVPLPGWGGEGAPACRSLGRPLPQAQARRCGDTAPCSRFRGLLSLPLAPGWALSQLGGSMGKGWVGGGGGWSPQLGPCLL